MDAFELPVELEHKILRQLCADNIARGIWNRLSGRLASYVWRDPEHRVVYETLRAVRSLDARVRREELPAQATRMGFPEVDWKSYLEPDRAGGETLERMIDHLFAASS